MIVRAMKERHSDMQTAETDPATIELLRSVTTDTIAGLLIKMGGMRTRAIRGVRPLNPGRCRFVGPAYTLRNVPIREDLTHRASMANPGSHLHGTVDAIPAGSVLVIDMLRDDSCGGLGDVLVAALVARGVVGIVADGGMRDGKAIGEMTIPVFAAGIAPAPSNRALLAADVQQVIGCGGVMVVPGDIVVGDEDGVVVIPQHLADEVARTGAEQERLEAWVKRRIELGAPATGLYPPDAEVKEEFRRWVEAGQPDLT
jgi:regulator of RNase E activity RraA